MLNDEKRTYQTLLRVDITAVTRTPDTALNQQLVEQLQQYLDESIADFAENCLVNWASPASKSLRGLAATYSRQ